MTIGAHTVPGGHHDQRVSVETQISRRLSGGEDVQGVLADVPALLTRSLNCSWAVVLEIFPERGHAGVIFDEGFSANGSSLKDANGTENTSYEHDAGGLAPDASLAGYVAALQRRACVVENLDEAPFWPPPALRAAGVRSAVAAKVEVFGEARYVVAGLYPEPISRHDPEVAGALDLMAHISTLLSAALEKEQLAGRAIFGDALQEFFVHLIGELKTAEKPEEVLRVGAEACVAELPGLPGASAADLCFVDLLNDHPSENGSSRTRIQRFHASASSATSERTRHSVETVPRLSTGAGPGKVIYSGEREFVEYVSPDYLHRLARDEEDLKRLEQVGARSYMAFPLRASRETIGCVGLLSTTPQRRYRPDLWRNVGEFIAFTISMFYAVRTLQQQGRGFAWPESSPQDLPDAPAVLARFWPGPDGNPDYSGATTATRTNGVPQRHATRQHQTPGLLTGRQYEVLTLLDEGLSVKGIARRLHVTDGTAQNHCTKLLQTLGVGSQVEALARARQLDILPR